LRVFNRGSDEKSDSIKT